jgi:hypothetical protein
MRVICLPFRTAGSARFRRRQPGWLAGAGRNVAAKTCHSGITVPGRDGVDAVFMLLERNARWLADAVERSTGHRKRFTRSSTTGTGGHTAWLPRSWRKSCMNAATMSYE